jgi:adenylate cyclase
VPSDNTEQRRLAAIMFTDMVGYSALSQRNEALALELLAEIQSLLRAQFPLFNGREVKNTGDGFLVEFPSALHGTQCAVQIQRALAARNSTQPAERQIQVRIGLHVGDVVHRGNDIYGDGVNIAARIEPLAEPGGICISNAVYEQIANKVEQPLVQLPRPELKNIQASVQVYKLVLDGSAGSGGGGQTQGDSSASGASSRRPRFATVVIILAAVILGLIVKFGASRKSEVSPANGEPAGATSVTNAQKSIAVLPFVNMSGDKADEYLSDGMTEELLNVLAQVPGLRVPGRSSSFAFKGKSAEDIFRKVGEQLHVTTVLEGSVRKAGDKLRITAQLINVSDGYHLWSETYDGDMKDILKVQSDVAQRVVQALELKLGIEATDALAKKPTENPEALRLYLLGRHASLKNTPEDSQKAVEYFNQALKLDPNYARAYCGLADTLGDWKLAPKDYVPKLRAYAETALKLDPQLAEAHLSQAGILFWADWDFPAAGKEFQRALKLNPNLALAHDTYAWYLAVLGRFPEALAEQKQAVELEPLSASMTLDLGWIYYVSGDLNKTIELAKQAVELDPSFHEGYQLQGWALVMQGKPHEAVPQMEKALGMSDNAWSRADVAIAYAAAGDRAKAEAMLKELDDLAARQFASPYFRAVAWAQLDENDRALALLERAVADRDPDCLSLKVEPAMGRLRKEPRFQALLKKVFPDK